MNVSVCRCLYDCDYVCVCVCVRERESESEREKEREGEREGERCTVLLFLSTYVQKHLLICVIH